MTPGDQDRGAQPLPSRTGDPREEDPQDGDPREEWTLDGAFRRFESRTNLERGGTPHLRQYRLNRMEALLQRLGNPQESLPVIHVAGSKGKGSTAAFTAELLAAASHRVGLYTSPHVTDYRERFRVLTPRSGTGETRETTRGDSPEEILLKESRRVWELVPALEREGCPPDELPTTFELLTALAFCAFTAADCEFALLETGLGGRLDATNLCVPLVTIITRLELEHQEYLGETLAEIAREKAGIIKPGIPLITAPQRREARSVLARQAALQKAPLLRLRPLDRSIPLTLGGEVQRINAALALGAFGELHRQGRVKDAPRRVLEEALTRTTLPGRGERLADLYLDGAHTPESVAQVVRTLTPPGGVAILGVVQGKDLRGIARALAPAVSRVVVSRPGTFKPGDPSEVFRTLLDEGIQAELIPDPLEALTRARELNRLIAPPAEEPPPIVVTGSFYMVGEIRRLVLAEPSPAREPRTARTEGAGPCR
ncbi:hypothetical protein AU468_00655 [Alkalispirochaeta sphaeroplastigenens]|uniref:Dihydrofolate synthase/folylpolyglutamate synthase n=1 Tax=Alkalispirochaeta sphaeroplastigenens TaxID=1187066 RepID=A0A2S4K0Y7_9SPIO|nr:hypothetical protein [Alkalispirochaeta sphaeroplastigenens]POR05419.1 hypothetical protein AU468_00655 [Alkalispirochaeta sphaeroplastigenens]